MKLFLISLLSFTIFSSSAFSRTLEEQYSFTFARQELVQNEYRKAQESLMDINRVESLKIWYRLFMRDKKNKAAFEEVMKSTKKSILGKDYRHLLFYLTVTGQHTQASHVLALYVLSALTLIDNFVMDPQSKFWNADLVEDLSSLRGEISFVDINQIQACYNDAAKAKRGFSLDLVQKMKRAVRKCAAFSPELNRLNLAVRYLFEKEKYHGAPFPVTYSGYVAGNKVELFSHTHVTAEDGFFLATELNHVLTTYSPLSKKFYKDMTIDDFKEAMDTPEAAITDLFTKAEGFRIGDEHSSLFPLSSQNHGIYSEMISAIRDAEESVFIDVFWIGGSIGLSLAQELIKKVNENPDFKVYVISDGENKFGYADEIDFVYNYMRAFSEKFIDKHFYIAPSNINLKRTALPEFVDLLITGADVETYKEKEGLKDLLENDGVHLLAKSDHSKVFVIDGLNPELGKAYVGSKNWIDSGGGINIDEVAKIQGPAVQLILNSFYYDIFEAFSNKFEAEGSQGGVKTRDLMRKHIDLKFPGTKNFKQGLKQILRGVDVLGRYRYNNPISVSNISVPYVPNQEENSVVAPAQNNIYGTEVSAVEQNIQAILSAKHQILIDDQFLYDRNIVEALKVAHHKNNVKIYLLIETLQSITAKNDIAAHIPNNLFVPDLVNLGIPVKWKLTDTGLKEAVIEANKQYGRLLSTTFHVKSIGIDGVLEKDQDSCNSEDVIVETRDAAPVLITGSANKDVLTMSGGFREYQVAVFDKDAVINHDCLFWSRWNDEEHAIATDGLDFDLPQQAVDAGVTDKGKFLEVIKNVIFASYDFTKDFFN